MIRFKYRKGEKDLDYVALSFHQQGMVTIMKYNMSKYLDSIQCPICNDKFDITIALSIGENRTAWEIISRCHIEFDELVKNRIARELHPIALNM
jgi:hypothetical protein